MIIYNDQVNELAQYRLGHLKMLPQRDVFDYVQDAELGIKGNTAKSALAITWLEVINDLWDVAVTAAFYNGELIGYFDRAIGDHDPVWPLNEVAKLVAERVARAILISSGKLD